MHILKQVTKSQGLNFLICRMGTISVSTPQEWELRGWLCLTAATVLGLLLIPDAYTLSNIWGQSSVFRFRDACHIQILGVDQAWTWSSVMLHVYLYTQFESGFIQVFSTPVWLHPSHEVRRSGVDREWCQIRTENISYFGAIWISNQITMFNVYINGSCYYEN